MVPLVRGPEGAWEVLSHCGAFEAGQRVLEIGCIDMVEWVDLGEHVKIHQ